MKKDAAIRPVSVLVTGAAGFVGRHVVSALLGRGHRVRALEHRNTLPAEIRKRCERLSGDICDPGLRKHALNQVDVVCHLAAYIPEKINALSEAMACYEVNALATLELAREAAEEHVQRFIYTSSGSVYAPLDRPCTETDRVFPDQYATSYAASKLAGEIYLVHVGRRSGMETVNLRLGTPYGPGAPRRQVVPTFMRCAAQGEPLHVRGHARYNFVWVEDVAYCVARAVESGPVGIYNVASGEHTSLRSLADTVATVYGDPTVTVLVEPASEAAFAGLPALSIARARQAWTFNPLSLAEGLSAYRTRVSTSGYLL